MLYIVSTKNRINLGIIPSPKDIPAMSEAIPVEKGLIADAAHPIWVPNTEIITTVIVSMPMARNMGRNKDT